MTKGTQKTPFNLKGRGVLGGLVSGPPPVSESSQKFENVAAEWIPTDRIKPGTVQPRQFFSQAGIDNLAKTFQKDGFRGALNVRPAEDGSYELVAGERRWRAAQQAGLSEVRCIVESYTDEEALEFALVENLQREDLSKLEETEGILNLIEVKVGIPRDQAIAIIKTEGHSDKRSRSDVAPSDELVHIEAVLAHFGIELQTFRTKNLRTLSLPEDLKQAHLEQNLSYSVALELNKVKDVDERQALLEEALDQKLSFREVKEKVRGVRQPKQVAKEPTLVQQLEATVRRVKQSQHLLEKGQKRKQLEKLLNELESLLDEPD
jgi:ParB family chromosome partitioning protein